MILLCLIQGDDCRLVCSYRIKYCKFVLLFFLLRNYVTHTSQMKVIYRCKIAIIGLIFSYYCHNCNYLLQKKYNCVCLFSGFCIHSFLLFPLCLSISLSVSFLFSLVIVFPRHWPYWGCCRTSDRKYMFLQRHFISVWDIPYSDKILLVTKAEHGGHYQGNSRLKFDVFVLIII